MTQWPTVQPVPDTMRAVTFREFGPPEVLKMEEVPTPRPAPGEVLIRVAAVSVGRLLDLLARSGKHPYAHFTFPHILGAEHSGVVAALGDGVDSVQVGDQVAAFPSVFPEDDEMVRSGFAELSPALQIIGTHRQGAYAEYVAVPAVNVRVVPPEMTPAEASAVMLSGTVAMNQFDRIGGIREGMRVVVPGATSALGSTTALLARHLGATVIVTSRSEQKRSRLRELGFDHVLDATCDDFAVQVKRVFDGKGAQVIVDNLGDEGVWRRGFDALAPGGTVVSSGAFLGLEVPINLKRLYTLGQRVVGVRTGNLTALDNLWTQVHDGFRTIVDRSFPLEDAASAHRYVEADDNVGRVTLTVG
jgi:NADPH:quinone reductase-like Zn-dependent oxidoreductase